MKKLLLFVTGFICFPVALFAILLLFLYYTSAPMLVSTMPKENWLAVDAEKLKQHVLALTGTKLPRHSENIEALEEAARYFEKEMKALGLTVVRQTYDAPSGKTYHNLSVLIVPDQEGLPTAYTDAGKEGFAKHVAGWPKKPILVVGAHYDVCWEQPGADDNASGVAGVIELGRALMARKDKINQPINLVAFTLEEPNYYDTDWMGSLVYAKGLHAGGVQIAGMISVEMIGYFKDNPGSQEYPLPILSWIYGDVGNYVAIVGKTDQMSFAKKIKRRFLEASDLPVTSINAPAFIEGVDYSDHRSFWQLGYEAVMVTDTSFFRNKNYHKASDTPEKLDYFRMGDVVRGLYQVAVKFE